MTVFFLSLVGMLSSTERGYEQLGQIGARDGLGFNLGERTENKMKTKLVGCAIIRRLCGLCGCWTEKDNCTVELLADDGERQAKTVCPACVGAGPLGAAERMRAEAVALREHAKYLDGLASSVAGIAAGAWVTLADAVAYSKEVDRQLADEQAAEDIPF